MSFPTMNDDMDIIAKLGDEPNEDDGLSAAGFKAVFDEAGKLCKAAINALAEALGKNSAAGNIGFLRSELIPEDTVQGAIENVQAQIQSVSQSGVANGSVTGAKMASNTLLEDVTNQLTLEAQDVGGYPCDVGGLKFLYCRALGMMFVVGTAYFTKTGSGVFAARYKVTGPFNFGHFASIFGHRSGDGESRVNFTPSVNSAWLEFGLENVSEQLEGNTASMDISGWFFCTEVT